MYAVAAGQLMARHGAAHASRISAIAFSDDGTSLASADEEGTIKVWAGAQQLTSKSTALRTLKGHRGSINTVRFSMDGKRLLSCGFKRPWEHRAVGDGTARVWNLEYPAVAFRPLERSARRIGRVRPAGYVAGVGAERRPLDRHEDRRSRFGPRRSVGGDRPCRISVERRSLETRGPPGVQLAAVRPPPCPRTYDSHPVAAAGGPPEQRRPGELLTEAGTW